jgi:glycosyltransferase involved in cell wall biosynthesis
VPLESLFPSEEPYVPEEPYAPGPPEDPFPGGQPYPGEQPHPGEQSYPGQPPFQAEYSYQPAPPYEPEAPYDAGYGPPAPYESRAAFQAPAPYETQPAYDAPPRAQDQPAYAGQPAYAEQPAYQPQPRYRGAPDDGREPHVSIILPCYNEQDHVLLEVERISRAMDASDLPYELLAVDDASTDATLERLRSAEPYFPRLRVIHFPRNGGSGTVRRIGTQQARGEIVVWTDADMSYPNHRIPEFVAMLEADPTVDQVVGARTSESGTHKIARVPAKWFIRKLAERLTNSEIPDLNSGLRAFRRSVAQPYLRLLPPGFSCVTTITLAFLSNEHGVRYVPIDYAKRAGVSKFHFFSDAYRYVLQVLRMVMYFNPLKVLMPPALFLICLGLFKGVYDMVVHPFYFAINTVLIFVTGILVASLALLADLIVRSRGDT